MTSVRKSPNMMSTTGRIPVTAAPTPRPVMPGSEIGESRTRSGPNSSTSPASTLNGVPASATSSPITNTVSSRRSSSASAWFTAWANVSSGIDVLGDLARIGDRRLERERETGPDLGARLELGVLQSLRRRQLLLLEPGAVECERVALAPPEILLLLRPVVRAVDVADVVPVIAVRVAEQERGPAAAARPLDELGRLPVDGAHVLPVDLARLDAERARPSEDLAGSRLEVVRVLVVLVVLADVDHGQRPQGRDVHHLVEQPLAERALAEEADGDLVGAAPLRGERGSGRDPRRAADDRVRAEVPVLVVGDVHRAALAAAVAGLLAEQLGEHPADLGSLREAVPVAAVRRRDPVLAPQRRAHADGDRLLTDVEMRQAGHLRAAVELVRLLLEEPDQRHPAVHLEREIGAELGARGGQAHGATRRVSGGEDSLPGEPGGSPGAPSKKGVRGGDMVSPTGASRRRATLTRAPPSRRRPWPRARRRARRSPSRRCPSRSPP